ncbi:hypothetical protein GCM10014713_37880 [Streptomyces purpureus]|uniref:Uncharacterized protein n=1 Tax=Streptomyces purpureus TaxID=1951 RepID=A0A918H5J6_9ACTN|nr:hypothetical protein GCM10014713_37880 [Streptomyces purpureus]
MWARRRAWSSLSKGFLAYLKMAVEPSGKVTRSTPDMDHTRTSSRTAVVLPVEVSRLSRSSALGFVVTGGLLGMVASGAGERRRPAPEPDRVGYAAGFTRWA